MCNELLQLNNKKATQYLNGLKIVKDTLQKKI